MRQDKLISILYYDPVDEINNNTYMHTKLNLRYRTQNHRAKSQEQAEAKIPNSKL